MISLQRPQPSGFKGSVSCFLDQDKLEICGLLMATKWYLNADVKIME